MNNKDEYDFCGLKQGECNYQINGDKKIEFLEKELEVYKKALKMACGTLSNFLYHHPENHIEEEMRGFLQKARGE